MLDIFRGCHLLLHILGSQTSSTYVINNKINDDVILTLFAREDPYANSKKNNHANEDGRSVIQNSVGVLTDSMDGQWDYQVADSVDSCTYCRQCR